MSENKIHYKPPKLAEYFLRKLLPDEGWDTPLGDFEEDYNEIVAAQGIIRAHGWYFFQIVKLLPGFIFNSIYWSLTMFRNYFKITWRNIVRQKGYSIINISGLAVGMASCILILMWVQHERSYDKYHEYADDIYRVVETQFYADGVVFPVAVTPSALAPALKEQFPEIKNSTRLTSRGWTIKYGDNIFYEGIGLADPTFLEIFTIPFIKGNPASALSDPHSILITEEMVEKYFANEDPVGKLLRINDRDDFTVTGVIKDFPDNSHIGINFLAPFIYLEELGTSMDNWGSNSHYTYILLEPGTDYLSVDNKIFDFVQKQRETTMEIHLQPLTEIHLYSGSTYAVDVGGHGDIVYVKIFSIVAGFILLIACINFMNLSTARSERRGKEVGLRKVIGARRIQIIKQFFSESIMMSTIAFIVALLLIITLLPVFNDLSGKNLSLSQFGYSIFIGFLAVVFATGILSGSYPALFLSSFKPVQTLIGSGGSHSKGSSFRKMLVVIQFSLSVIMIIGTLVVSQQLDYIRGKNLGLDKENLLLLSLTGDFGENYRTAKQELLSNPNITDITVTSQLPTYVARSTASWDWDGKEEGINVLMHFISVGPDYVNTFKMEMAEGRFYSKDHSVDSINVVVNERAVEAMGMDSPIGKRLSIGGSDLSIIGVVKNFHIKPIQTMIEPLVMIMQESMNRTMVVRTKPENISNTIEFVENTYKELNPDTPFEYSFLNERYESQYRSEQRIGKLSTYFAGIAILIACLGLFGLAAYMAEQKKKEIGIRKVLGASSPSIFHLLSRNFIFLVAISNIIAWPIAYYFLNNWLQNYAYHTSLTPTVFILAAGMAVVIALLTVSYQAIKATHTNLVKSLRYE